MKLDIKKMLETEIENFARIGYPALMQRFVVNNGSVMTPIDEFPEDVEPGEKQLCFMNATNLAQMGYQYVEGYGCRKEIGIPIHHAWVVDCEGRVIDNTWRNPQECVYMGVEFDLDVLCEEIDRNGVYGLLTIDEGINVDLLFKLDGKLVQCLDEFDKKRQAGLNLLDSMLK
jgi:hypothetical protein